MWNYVVTRHWEKAKKDEKGGIAIAVVFARCTNKLHVVFATRRWKSVYEM